MHCNALEHFSEKSNVVKKNWQKSDKSDVVKKNVTKKWQSDVVQQLECATCRPSLMQSVDSNRNWTAIYHQPGVVKIWHEIYEKFHKKTLQKYRWHTFRKYTNDWVFSQLIVLMVFSLDLGVAVEAASCILCLSNMEQEPVESDCWFYEI